MSASLHTEIDRVINPLDVLEQIIAGNEWVFERRSDEEMAAEAPGAPRSSTEWRNTGTPSSASMPKCPIQSRSFASASNSYSLSRRAAGTFKSKAQVNAMALISEDQEKCSA